MGASYTIRRYRIGVITPDFQSGDGGSIPPICSVGTQRVKDVVWDLFPQTQYRKLSSQSTGLALLFHGVTVNTTGFEPVISGSNPDGTTKGKLPKLVKGPVC